MIPPISSIRQIALSVSDLETARHFFADLLGAQCLFSVPGMHFFGFGDVRLMLAQHAAPTAFVPSENMVLYFRVEDIARVHAELATRGIAFRGAPFMVARMPDHEFWLAPFSGPDGYVFSLCEEKKIAPVQNSVS